MTVAPAPPPARGVLRPMLFLGLILAIGLWLVIALLPGYLSRDVDAPPASVVNDAPAARRIQATLFAVSDDGLELVPVTRDVSLGSTPAEQARHIVAAQVEAPSAGSLSPVPAGTRLLGLYLGSRGEAYVDLSAEATRVSGGSLAEALAVFAIVHAVTTNLPDVSAVQILVDGKEVDSLAGHIDLREPIRRSAAWIRKGT